MVKTRQRLTLGQGYPSKIELTPFLSCFFFNPVSKKTASVPVHGNEYLSSGLLKEVLRDIDLSVEEYEKLRQKV